jgi:drug/metabolite transporter (DMT)-like permease
MTARQGFLLLHLAVLLFGLSGLIGKTVETPASVVTCLRSLIGAVAIAALIRGRRESIGAWKPLARKTFPGGALLAAHWWSFFASIQLGSVALGLLTYASYPLFAALFHGSLPTLLTLKGASLIVAAGFANNSTH